MTAHPWAFPIFGSAGIASCIPLIHHIHVDMQKQDTTHMDVGNVILVGNTK